MNRKLASLTFEIVIGADNAVPTAIRIIPSGQFKASDGRPHEVPSRAWLLNEQLANAVITKIKAKADDTLIDYNHWSFSDDSTPEQAISAAWFHDAEYRDDGLYALGVKWTPRAESYIKNKEYRYLSPLFYYDSETGNVLELESVALTNTPALDGLDDLIAALSKKHTQENTMPEDAKTIASLTVEVETEKARVASLTVERDELKTNVAALTTERDELKAEVAALKAEKVATAVATEKAQCTELLTAALTSGKVLPAHKAYLEKKATVAELKEAIDVIGSNGLAEALLSKQHQNTTTGAHDLTDAELVMCKKMGVSPEDYMKAKGA